MLIFLNCNHYWLSNFRLCHFWLHYFLLSDFWLINFRLIFFGLYNLWGLWLCNLWLHNNDGNLYYWRNHSRCSSRKIILIIPSSIMKVCLPFAYLLRFFWRPYQIRFQLLNSRLSRLLQFPIVPHSRRQLSGSTQP